jgi:hypothetical protein
MSVNRFFSDQDSAQDLSVFGGDSRVVWRPFAASKLLVADGLLVPTAWVC